MGVASVERVHTQSIVLDIGQDIGALIVYTSPALRGREIEVSPTGNAARRTHTEVLERTVVGRTVWAAVFPALAAGDYSLWRDVLTDDEVTIVGATVAEVDWCALTDASAFRLARPDRLPNGTPQAAPVPPVPFDALPPRYQQGTSVSATPMGSAPLRYTDAGQVAWDQMWTAFCDLALAGGPRHRDTLLEPPTPEQVRAAHDAYERVVAQIERGLQLVTGLPTARSASPGWVGLQCDDEAMARWLLRAIAEENVSIRREGTVLFLPAGPTFRVDKEIKNVVTVIAKTHHYWKEHRRG
ncbi:MAG TPA: hypothetical protein VKF37_05435 [Chloroflexota bacterium]|nr:hypothetical protein [Chloroflexota bacterium]